MINFGIGVDIENIERFKTLDKSILNKIFTKNEINYCFSKKEPSLHLAARFSGKEAIFKALNSIIDLKFNYKEIEILNDLKGAPYVVINKKQKNVKDLLIKISLSHCNDKSIAFVIISKVNYEK